MKSILLLISCIIAITNKSYSQTVTLDNIESSFQRVTHSTAFPCTWKLLRKLRPGVNSMINELAYFIRNDSTKYEVDFFKTEQLPFYKPQQTNFETSLAFFNWDKKKLKDQKDFSITKLTQNAADTFLICKIKNTDSEFYRLLVTSDNVTYSIKLFPAAKVSEAMVDDLKLLGSLNIKN